MPQPVLDPFSFPLTMCSRAGRPNNTVQSILADVDDILQQLPGQQTYPPIPIPMTSDRMWSEVFQACRQRGYHALPKSEGSTDLIVLTRIPESGAGDDFPHLSSTDEE